MGGKDCSKPKWEEEERKLRKARRKEKELTA
jgi:hypothetical protein